ncbi:MAG: hypothetical protein VCE43_17980 [Myxococcota bacterium]
MGVALAWASIAAQAIWVDHAIIERTRDATEMWSSPRGEPDEDDAPIAYYVDFDGYYFVDYARKIARGHGPRIRWTHLDNTPDGRAVHWSSAFPWWLVGIGAVTSAVSGESLDEAVRSAAYFANPLLFAIGVAAAGAAVWWIVGGVPAGALALTLATSEGLLRAFGYAKPDHHGIHIVFALGLVLCCFLGGAGWVSNGSDSLRSARRWMIASGVFGGLGLWSGATQMSVVISGVGLGAVVAMWIGARDEAGLRSEPFHPELWRVWAWAGGATSLAAFALEYLPRDGGMRLEVNHPLHALSWICAGHLLYCFGQWRRERFEPSATGLMALAGSLLGVVLLPLSVAFGPPHWFWPKDPYMLNLHDRIAEFRPFFAESRSVFAGVATLGLPALAAITLTGWVLRPRRHGDPEIIERARAWVILMPCWLLFMWVLAQGRWLGLFGAIGSCTLVLLCAIAVDRLRQVGFRVGWAALLAAVVLVGLANLGAIGIRLGASTDAPAPAGRISQIPLAIDVFLRDLAANLCPPDRHRGAVRILTGPSETARLHQFGRCRGVGSPFWENVDGVRATANFFAASGDAEARRIVTEREIDYVLIANSVPFVEYMDLVRNGTLDSERASQTLGYRLIHAAAPDWLRAVSLRNWPAARNWRLYRVELDRSIHEGS